MLHVARGVRHPRAARRLAGRRGAPLGGGEAARVAGGAAAARGRDVSTERLVDELWGEQPPATAIKAVQVYVSQLRKALGEGVVETRPLGYVLRIDDGALDVQRFESLLDEGRRLLASGAAARAARRAPARRLALWRARRSRTSATRPFAQNEIGRLEELRLVGARAAARGGLALGRHAEAVPELEALVRDHPLRESLRAAADAGALPHGPAGGRARRRSGRARDAASTSSASTRARRCSGSRRRSCCRTRRSTCRRGGAAAAPATRAARPRPPAAVERHAARRSRCSSATCVASTPSSSGRSTRVAAAALIGALLRARGRDGSSVTAARSRSSSATR